MSRTFQKFLVPVDLSPHAQEALQCTAALAARVEATLLVLHIIGHDSEMLRRGASAWDILGKTTKLEDMAIRSARYGGPQYVPQMVQVDVLAQAQHELQKWLCSQFPDPVAEARVEEGQPVEQILRMARRDQVDLIVMGTHGRTGLARMVLGSVAEQVVRQAPCPVMTVKASTPPGS